MNFLFCIILLLTTATTTLQAQQCRVSYVNPNNLLKELYPLKMQGNYDSIINILEEKRATDSILDACYYYQMACFLSLKGDTVMSFENIYKTMAFGRIAEPDEILSEVDFANLRNTKQWALLKDTLNQIYLSRYPEISNKKLSVQLWHLWIEDQSTRTLSVYYKKKPLAKGSKEWKKIQEQFRKGTNKRAKFSAGLAKKGQWPLYSEVGREAADAAILFIAHSDKKKYTKAVLKAMKEAVDKREASAQWYAVTYDRYCESKDRKQLYGTAITRYGSSPEFTIWPIEDEKNVDERRKAIGLGPLKNYLKKFDIDYAYDPANENKKLPHRNTAWGTIIELIQERK